MRGLIIDNLVRLNWFLTEIFVFFLQSDVIRYNCDDGKNVV